MEKLGVIGLGAMGSVMTHQLLCAGHEVYVCDPDSAAVAQAVMRGAYRCEGPAHVADNAEIVLSCLPSAEAVAEVALGDCGVVYGQAVRCFVDHSTIGPTAAAAIAAGLADKGILALDAPLGGSVAAARACALSVMVGGDRRAFEQCEGVFKVFGPHVVHVGDRPGLGQALKLVNNMIVGATLVATLEAALFGIKAGLDPQRLMSMVNASAARSFTSESIVARAIADRSFNAGFRIDLMLEDIRLFLDEAQRVGAWTIATGAAKPFFDKAIADGHGGADMTRMIAVVEALAGASLARAA